MFRRAGGNWRRSSFATGKQDGAEAQQHCSRKEKLRAHGSFVENIRKCRRMSSIFEAVCRLYHEVRGSTPAVDKFIETPESDEKIESDDD